MASEIETFHEDQETVQQIREGRTKIYEQMENVIVGQRDVIEQLLISLFAGGHCLITGAPGLAKTLLVRSIADIFDLNFNRIQFTPDLMPADITGTEFLEESPEGRKLRFVKGPVFSNVILADEINRTPPKTQAALLEAMQEHQVTAAGVRYRLEEPFFVLATQNPIEQQGTHKAELEKLFSAEDVIRFHKTVRKVPIAESLVRYAVQLADASRPNRKDSPDFVNQWVSWGAGTRAGQNLVLGAKARALFEGRAHVTVADIQALAHPVLRHRILPGYRAQAEGIGVDVIIDQLLDHVKTP